MRRNISSPTRWMPHVLLAALLVAGAWLFLPVASARAGDVALSVSVGVPVVQRYYVPAYGYAYPGVVLTTHYRDGHHPYYGRHPYYYGKRPGHNWWVHRPHGKGHYRMDFRHRDHGGRDRHFNRNDRNHRNFYGYRHR